jgi:hypothetical protein
MNEPSVLDYLKSKLMPWKYPPLEWPRADGAPTAEGAPPAVQVYRVPSRAAAPLSEPPAEPRRLPWLSLLALGLALAAQFTLEPGGLRSGGMGIILYALSGAALVWSMWSGEWQPPDRPLPAANPAETFPIVTRRPQAFIAALLAGLVAFAASGGGFFNPLNTLAWFLAIVLLVYAFWQGPLLPPGLLSRLRRDPWSIHLSRWHLALLGAALLVFFFRFYRLADVPPEMNSDHAEKLLDVLDVIEGQTRIFFPRNTGREALQFHLTAAVVQIFGTGISFLSLKLGTALAGLVSLVYIYLLGKEVGGRETGLWALAFAGIAYWPNVITRIALRFALYPLAAAPALFYLVRGIRRSNRNDFILGGIFLGIGLHGYSAARLLPVVFAFGVVIYLLHRQARGRRDLTIFHLNLAALAALFVFLPLLRFLFENPDAFLFRSLTRLGELERALPGPAWQIFLTNLWRAWIMPFWSDGEIWLHSVPFRPALSLAAAALYFLGSLTLLVRYLRQRHWLDLFLLLAVPLLMLPSILSLAFPNENPSLNRTSGAVVVVFVIIGLALSSLTAAVRAAWKTPGGRRLGWGLALVLLLLSARQDYDLVFNQYARQYARSAWNTSEMGAVIRGFAASGGDPNSAWVVSYPHWADTRLVGMQAGYPEKDYAIFPDNLEDTLYYPGARLFLLKPEDEQSLQRLAELYPTGWVIEYISQIEGKNFLIFHTPPED